MFIIANINHVAWLYSSLIYDVRWCGASQAEWAHLARPHVAWCVVRLRSVCSPPRGDLICHAALPPNPPRFSCMYCFSTRFSGQHLEAFWCSKWVSRSLLSNDMRFARIEVRTGELWLPEVGVLELFFRVFSTKILAKWGMPLANRELRLAAAVAVFLTHPGSQIKSQWAGKNPRAKAVVRFSARFLYFLSVFARTVDLVPDIDFRCSWYRWKACATPFLKVLDLWEIELGLEKYGPANRDHRDVFGPPEGIFPIEIPARPGKILVIQKLHIVSEHVLFLTHPGSRIKSQRARKNLCTSATSFGGKLWNFQQSPVSSISFRARGRHSSRCRISAILVSLKSLHYLLS